MHPFFKMLRKIESETQLEELLNITFTEKEQAMIVERWRILSLLDQGLSQRAVAEKVKCSVVTVTRGAKTYRENKDQIQAWLKIES